MNSDSLPVINTTGFYGFSAFNVSMFVMNIGGSVNIDLYNNFYGISSSF